MKKTVIISFFATILMAESLGAKDVTVSFAETTQVSEVTTPKNPRVYSALGDIIYDNVDNIVKLKEIDSFDAFSFKIDNYSTKVIETKEIGFSLESGNKTVDKITYLDTLRALTKENDYFVRSVRSAYRASVKNENSTLFIDTVNSGLVNTDKYKDEMIEYYLSHSEDVNASGVIQGYLDEDAALKSKRKSTNYAKAKRLREEAKIKRLRESDKQKQAEIEKSLQEAVKKTKIEIRQNQKKELFN